MKTRTFAVGKLNSIALRTAEDRHAVGCGCEFCWDQLFPRDSDAAAIAAPCGDMVEQWRSVLGYTGAYEVSNHGRVRNSSGHVLSPGKDKDGYLLVCLCKFGNQRSYAVHRLVARAFHKELQNPLHHEVAHLDGNRTNNQADNLKWVSKRENEYHKIEHGTAQRGERGTNAKLTEAQVVEIRSRHEGHKQVAAEFGVHPNTVKLIRAGKLWRHVPKDQQARADKHRPKGVA